MNTPIVSVNPGVLFARSLEVTTATWNNGMAGSSGATGIGIGDDMTNLGQSPQEWTLLDQHEVARTPQSAQYIGGYGYTVPADWPGSGGNEGWSGEIAIDSQLNPVAGDGDGTLDTSGGEATLADLAIGWTFVVPPP
jgi:hypothetical protein